MFFRHLTKLFTHKVFPLALCVMVLAQAAQAQVQPLNSPRDAAKSQVLASLAMTMYEMSLFSTTKCFDLADRSRVSHDRCLGLIFEKLQPFDIAAQTKEDLINDTFGLVIVGMSAFASGFMSTATHPSSGIPSFAIGGSLWSSASYDSSLINRDCGNPEADCNSISVASAKISTTSPDDGEAKLKQEEMRRDFAISHAISDVAYNFTGIYQLSPEKSGALRNALRDEAARQMASGQSQKVEMVSFMKNQNIISPNQVEATQTIALAIQKYRNQKPRPVSPQRSATFTIRQFERLSTSAELTAQDKEAMGILVKKAQRQTQLFKEVSL